MSRNGPPGTREGCGYSRSGREPLKQHSAIEAGFMTKLLHNRPLPCPDR